MKMADDVVNLNVIGSHISHEDQYVCGAGLTINDVAIG